MLYVYTYQGGLTLVQSSAVVYLGGLTLVQFEFI